MDWPGIKQEPRNEPLKRIIIIIIDLIALNSIYLLENLHLPQTVGGVSFSEGRKSIWILKSRGVSYEFAYYMTRL